MNKFEQLEKRMNEWQSGIRTIYKDVQTIHNWTDEQVWNELENEIKRITSECEFGEDDLSWTREILKSKRDVTLWEAARLIIRFKHSTPLLDSLGNLRARDKSGT